MNLQSTHNFNGKKMRKAPVRHLRKREKGNARALLPLIFAFCALFILAAVSVRFNSETEKLNRQSSALKRQIHKFERDIANLNIKSESLKGKIILVQIKHFNLKLHYPTPGQIRVLRLSSGTTNRLSTTTGEPRLLLSRR